MFKRQLPGKRQRIDIWTQLERTWRQLEEVEDSQLEEDDSLRRPLKKETAERKISEQFNQ